MYARRQREAESIITRAGRVNRHLLRLPDAVRRSDKRPHNRARAGCPGQRPACTNNTAGVAASRAAAREE